LETIKTLLKNYALDDGYLKNRKVLNRKGFEHYRNHKKTVQELIVFNDRLFVEIPTTEVNREICDEYLRVIEKRAIELIEKHPDLKNNLKSYLALQKEECDILKNELEGVIWVIKKRSS